MFKRALNLSIFLLAKIKEAYWEKFERAMTAAAFAEEGVFDEAKKIIKKEK